MLTKTIKPNPIWYQIIITFTATLTFLLLLWFVLIVRSRRRHKSILRIAKMAQMPTASFHDLRYLYGDAASARLVSSETARCTKIAQLSLGILENKINAPFNSERQLLPLGFLAGVCHDMRRQAVIFHEELLHVIAKIPEMSGRTNSMSLQEVFQFLSRRYTKRFTKSISSTPQRAGKSASFPPHYATVRNEGPFVPQDALTDSHPLESGNTPSKQIRLQEELLSPVMSPHEPQISEVGKLPPTVGDKLIVLLRIHEVVRYGPPKLRLSKDDWLFYAEGMEEVLHTARSCVKL